MGQNGHEEESGGHALPGRPASSGGDTGPPQDERKKDPDRYQRKTFERELRTYGYNEEEIERILSADAPISYLRALLRAGALAEPRRVREAREGLRAGKVGSYGLLRPEPRAEAEEARHEGTAEDL